MKAAHILKVSVTTHGAARPFVFGAALSSAGATACALHGASLFFVCAKKSKQKKAPPFMRVHPLRGWTSLAPSPLRGPPYKGHPWPFTPFAASMPLTPLNDDSTRPPARGIRSRLLARASREAKQSKAGIASSRQLGPGSPSGGRAQALRRGTRGRDAERGTKGQGRPFVTCPRSNAGERVVWSHSDQTRMQGWPSFWLLFLGHARKSDAPCKAQPVLPAEESVTTEYTASRHTPLRVPPDEQRTGFAPWRFPLRSPRAFSECA